MNTTRRLRITTSISTAYILAGGRSSRFGTDKSLHESDGEPQIVRLAKALIADGLEVIAVVDELKKFDHLRFDGTSIKSIADDVNFRGPLEGIYTALRDYRSRQISTSTVTVSYCLILSCDLLEWKHPWLQALDEVARNAISKTAVESFPHAIAFHSADLWQPFPSLFHLSSLRLIEEYLQRGLLSLQRLLSDERMHTSKIIREDLPPILSANTIEEWRKLKGNSKRGVQE